VVTDISGQGILGIVGSHAVVLLNCDITQAERAVAIVIAPKCGETGGA